MLVSHEHRFIFIKTRKTAGTSVEITLSRYCGPDDIVTPIAREDEEIRRELGVVPRNYETPRHRRPREHKDVDAYRNHMPAALVRNLVGRRVWDRYFKFCVVRNPWSQVTSMRRWAAMQGNALTLAEVIERPLPVPNWKLYTIDNEIAMDYVGRYETLLDSLDEACGRIGLPFDGWMPHAKQSVSGVDDYTREYTPELIEAVRRRHAAEIEHFGYAFGAPISPVAATVVTA